MKLRHKLLIGLPVIAVVCVAALLWGIQHTGKRALADAMAGVVADGGVADFRGFARPDLADADNAAVAWLAAVEPLEGIDAAAPTAVRPVDPDDPYSGGVTETYAPEVEAIEDSAGADLAVLRSALDKRQAVIESLWAAADLEEVCWPLDYDDPATFHELLYYGEMRQAARLLKADAVAALANGNPARADRSLTAALAAADDLAAVPMVINVFIAWSIDGLVLRVVRDADRGGRAELPDTRAVLAGRDDAAALRRALLAEPAFMLAFGYDDPAWGGTDTLWDDDNPVPAGLRGIAGRLWRRHDLAFNTERLRELAGLSGMAYTAAAPRAEALAERKVPAVFPLSRMGVDLGRSTLRTAALTATTRGLCVWAGRRGAGAAPEDPLMGGTMRRWDDPGGGVVLWSAEAAAPTKPDVYRHRSQLVWRVGTDALPPELLPFAGEINDVD